MGNPVARCAVDVPLAHLDRSFDYAVPPELDAGAQPGCRIRVRFAGRLVDGVILERRADTDVDGTLSPLTKLVSAEPVLTGEQITLLRAVADHCAGSFTDVLRLAVPPRHAATEKANPPNWPVPDPDGADRVLPGYPHGSGFLETLRVGGVPRAAWLVAPSGVTSSQHAGAEGITEAVASTLASGRGAIVTVPDVKAVETFHRILQARLGERSVAVLHAEMGPSSRYRNYLALRRDLTRVVVGTRSAIFAPVTDLGLIAVWDDGDDLHSEPRAPYHHVRDVAALRAAGHSGLLFAGFARSVETQSLVQRGWLAAVELPGVDQRRRSPQIRITGDEEHDLARDRLAGSVRFPSAAFDTVRLGLTSGPVLIQVPRSGYQLALCCTSCREPARCPHCRGGLRREHADSDTLSCGLCGRIVNGWTCPECGSRRLRAPVLGARRTVEELGRAFPGVRVVDSSSDHVISTVGDQSALVIATPGAEPLAATGYAAAVLLDTQLALSRPDLRVADEALRRWLNAIALVRPGGEGGAVRVVGNPQDRTLQALVRVDPRGHAERELAERIEAGFPPAVRLVSVEGSGEAVRTLLAQTELPPGAQLLGPVAAGRIADVEIHRATLRAPLTDGAELVAAVRRAMGIRSARKQQGPLRVKVDPQELQ